MEALTLSNAHPGLWPDPGAPAIIVANHASYFDGPLIALLSPRPILFGVDPDFSLSKPWRWILRGYAACVRCDFVPMWPGRLTGLRQMLAYLNSGGWVCVFPEGGISTGEKWGGADWLAAKSGATIHTLRLHSVGVGKFKLPYALRPGGGEQFRSKTLTA